MREQAITLLNLDIDYYSFLSSEIPVNEDSLSGESKLRIIVAIIVIPYIIILPLVITIILR
jgi:hypothetical protein